MPAPPSATPPPFPAGVHLPEVEIYHKLLETAPDAMIVSDLDGVIVYVNHETERAFQWSRAELVNKPVEVLLPERLRLGHRAHRENYARSPTSRPMGIGMTLIAMRKDGSEFPVEISLSPVRLDGKSFVSATARDVSHLQSARDAMTRAHYHAHVAELGQKVIGARHLEDVTAAVPEVVARALRADVVVVLLPNAAGSEFVSSAAYGVPEHMQGEIRVAIDPNSEPHITLRSGETVSVPDYAIENRFQPDPTVSKLGLRCALAAPIMDNKDLAGVLVARFRGSRAFSGDDRNFLRSIANVVGAAMKYLHAEERLRHAQQIEAVGQLTGGIAHDFNNLLTVIIGNLQLIEEDVQSDASIAQPIEAALRAASSAADLTRKLLAFSRRQALRPRPTDVNELVGGMLDMIRRALGERITIIAYPDTTLALALADPGQLETALLNLVVNARDAMPKGGRLSIETGERELDASYANEVGDLVAGRYAMISVSDNGTGMPAHVVKRAFDPYFTTKERGKGSGLGLSMVHGFAKQSGGHVTLYSEPGRGTTVRIYLPLASQLASSVRSSPQRLAPGGNETILMVEDDEAVRGVGARFLSELGSQVLLAADGDTALALLDARNDVRLLFTDIVLPGRLDGVELASHALNKRPGLALLFTSGYASGVIEGLDRLPGSLLDKPYCREDLARAVRQTLDQQ
jgi:PAS domain S-box-containing protein